MRPVRPWAVAALALAACGRDGELAHGVQHLDPRLADGRSSADVLAARRRVVASPSIEELRASVAPGAPAGVVQAVLDTEDAVDVVELDFTCTAAERVIFHWREDPKGSEASGSVAELPWQPELVELAHIDPAHADESGLVTVRFVLGDAHAWRGGSWRMGFDSGRSAKDALRAVRFLQVGFLAGDEPMHRELVPRDFGDGGLVAQGRDARRAWPADLGVPLFARVRVPRGGRFAAALSFPRSERKRIEAVLHVREGGGAWRETGRGTFDGASAGDRWMDLEWDLGRFVGEDVELRLLANAAGHRDEVLEREPERARVLWGEPRVLGELAADRRPDLVLVTLDTTRADGVGGGQRTPALDRLAEGGTVFTNAFAPTNSTQPSHTSILSGFAMQDHGVADNYAHVPGEVTTVAERLRGAGWLTAAAVSQPCIGLGTGLAQGFDRFLHPGPETHLDGRETLEGVEHWLAELRSTDAPLFLWVHLYDPHTPYTPPAEFVQRHVAEHGLTVPPRTVEPPTLPVVDLLPPDLRFLHGASNLDHARFQYAVGVSYADFLFGELVLALERAGRADSSAWIVTADHGESLGERESYFNHRGLFTEVTRVPLIVRLPQGAADLPRRVDLPVSGVDVAPTLLELAGIFGGIPSRGRSLLGTARDAQGTQAALHARTVWFEHASSLQVGCTDGRYYFVTTPSDAMVFGTVIEIDAEGRRVPVSPPVPKGRSWLFDLAADPELAHDLSAEEPERVQRFLDQVELWRRSAGGLTAGGRAMTPEQAADLSHLGYVDPETGR